MTRTAALSLQAGPAPAGSILDTSSQDEGTEMGNDNFQVVIRVRPPLARELNGFQPYQHTVAVDPSRRGITLSENLLALQEGGVAAAEGLLYATYRFTFDQIFDTDATQEQVYLSCAQQVVLSTLQGYNAAIIAYGQTGTGKTFTVEGVPTGPDRGIVPRAIEDIFHLIETDSAPSSKYLVRASYLQIYNEVISDLLKPERSNLVIREDRRRGIYVDGLSEWVVRNSAEVLMLMQTGQMSRTTGATKLNEISSRSHAVFILIVENASVQSFDDDGGAAGRRVRKAGPAGTYHSFKVGKLNLVDLAGSERVHITGATGKRLEESKKINQSLSALGNVIAGLTDDKPRQHIPYRDSKLTRILEDSLGGNCRTTMMAMVSPALDAFQESLSTLKFANRAKHIRNQALVNEDVDQHTLLRKYERELKQLRNELQQRSRQLVDKRSLLQLEEERRRAEEDKLAAIEELEKRSLEVMEEKAAKQQLEHKIQEMQSQLLIGGQAHDNIEDTPVFRTLLAREQRRMRGEYQDRLKDLELERHRVEEDVAQVDRYKLLLLKQRDIMIALTARLNERDEQILANQEELEELSKYQSMLEDTLDRRTSELIALRKAVVQQAGGHPLPESLQPLPVDGNAATVQNQPEAQHPRPPLVTWDHESLGAATPRTSSPCIGTGDMPAAAASEPRPGHDDVRGSSCSSRQQPPAAADGGHWRAKVSSLQQENARLTELNARLHQQLKAQPSAAPRSGDSLRDRAAAAEAIELREQCEHHVKERVALKTILDQKIRTLVADISASVSQAQATGGGSSRLSRQVAALNKLVTATVNAMCE